MKGERTIVAYVATHRELEALERADPADIADYEHTLKQKRLALMAYYRSLNGGQLAEARRRLRSCCTYHRSGGPLEHGCCGAEFTRPGR